MRQVAVLALVIAIGFISVPGCSSAVYEPHLSSAPAGVSRTDPAIISLIEPTVSATDWPIVYDMLAELPPYARENVIITLPDRTISNRPELVEANPSYVANASGGMAFPTTPPCIPSQDFGHCTGVFRRHASANNVGSYFGATVNLPCKLTHVSAAPGATGYLYSTHYEGGTSWEGGFAMVVTTGMGYPKQVLPYVKEEDINSEDQLATIGSPRLKCDDGNVTFETWTLQKAANDQNPSAVLFVNGVFNVLPNGEAVCVGSSCKVTYLHPFTKYPKIWTQTCTTCTTAWTTSLAVTGPNVNYTVQNTWFGVQGAALPSTASPAITWSGAVVGTFSSYGSQATATTTAFPQASVMNDPASVPDLILTSNSSASGETIGINAHGNIAATVK